MSDFAREVVPVDIEEEMKQSYLDYAMSVIVGRALPDVRDGLKPVHRRVLHAMRELGNDWNRPYKKSARVVGDTIGKYHPHGEGAVYDALVRMAQQFSMRAMLVDGQGNFGSVDGDPPAAMRYTEVRMSRAAHELLADIDKETVDFVANYDGSEREPSVFPDPPSQPSRQRLVGNRGGHGHQHPAPQPRRGGRTPASPCSTNPISASTTSCRSCRARISRPRGSSTARPGFTRRTAPAGDGSTSGPAPSFETADGGAHERIVVSELPYQVNKARLMEKIAELVKEKRIEGISALRDESDKEGMRVVIELRRGENAEVMLNNLYRLTTMETVFGINLVRAGGRTAAASRDFGR